MKINKAYIVKNIDYNNKSAKKLIDMGIIPQTTIKIVGVAPLGNPIIIEANGYKLAVRKNDLGCLNLS